MGPSKLSQRFTGGIPPSALGKGDPQATAPRASLLSTRMDMSARGEEVELPMIGRVYMQLLGHQAANQVEGATFKAMEAAGLPPIALHAWSYDMQRQARTLAVAARDPDSRTEPMGTLEEWLALDDSLLFACGRIYQDVKERLDPVGTLFLPPDTADEITEAFKKKDVSSLRSHGVVLLTSWLLSGAVQLSSSPTPASKASPSNSSDDSSEE